MPSYKKINDAIYSIMTDDEEDSGMVFVTGKSNFLIDCGASDFSIDRGLIPAFKKMGYNLRNIHYVVFTHCGSNTSGGAHRLRELAPDARFLTLSCQSDRLRNPTFYENNSFAVCPDFAPPLREIRGVFVDSEPEPESVLFSELRPIPAPGHDSDCVCWYHLPSRTLICGEALQADGSDRTGCAVILDPQAYRESLRELAELQPETLLCPEGLRGVQPAVYGRAQCLDAINACLDYEERYETFAREHLNTRRSQKLPITLEELVTSYFVSRGFKPAFLGYSMQTFYNYVKLYL